LNPIGLIVAGVILLVAGFILLYKKVDWFRAAVNFAFKVVTGAISGAFTWVKKNWPLLLAILTGPIGLAVLAIVKNWDKIKAGVSGVKDWIVARFNAVVGFMTGLPGRIAALAGRLWGSIASSAGKAKDAVVGKLQSIIDWVKALPGKVSGALRGVFDGLVGAGKAAFNGLANVWNKTIGSFSVSIPDWVPQIGGKGFSFPKLPTLARGGPLRPGWNVVGEMGPELVRRSGAPARAFSHAQSSKLTGRSSNAPSVNLTVNYPLPEKVSVALPRLLRSAATQLVPA
jgi:hypothetical protein